MEKKISLSGLRFVTGVILDRIKAVDKKIYPVGSLYISVNETSPAELFGGVWERFGQGRALVGVDTEQEEFNAPGKTGGEKTHKLTPDEMPSHGEHLYKEANMLNQGDAVGKYLAHSTLASYGSNARGWRGIDPGSNELYPAGQNLGGDGAHNNLQPYITCFMWVRTA